MNTDLFLITGIVGMALILIAFLMNQLKKWSQDMLSYDACNALGSLLLLIYAYDGRAWPFVILNGVWFAYSMRDTIIDIAGRR
jgi:hypothetical protein